MSKLKLVVRSSAVLMVSIFAVASFAPAASAQASSVTVNHGYTELVLDPSTAQVLTNLGVSVAPISPAWIDNGGVAFPITDGLFGILGTGAITHSGGLALTAGSTTVQLTDFDIELAQRDLTAVVDGGSRLPILSLSFTGAKLGFSSGTLSIGPVVGDLTAQAAAALNAAFNDNGAIPAGVELGTATVNLQL